MSVIINADGAVTMSIVSAAGNTVMLVTDKKNLNDGKWHHVDLTHAKTRSVHKIYMIECGAEFRFFYFRMKCTTILIKDSVYLC